MKNTTRWILLVLNLVMIVLWGTDLFADDSTPGWRLAAGLWIGIHASTVYWFWSTRK